ncbi:MAG: LysR family transcriptional regulator [Brachybacterium sp.]|nr:LysR family transcriptional regulator [Brachybacterium sp.]
MLSLHRLRMLSELHRLGTVADVARVLSYTPSAVSQQLALLQKEAGVPLTEKVGRRLRLTDAGLDLVGHADAILARLAEAESELAGHRPDVSGTLRISSFQTPLLSILPHAVAALEAAHPHLHLLLTQRELPQAHEALLAREDDLILGEEFPGVLEPLVPGLDREPLLPDPLLLVTPTSGTWSRATRLADLADAPWILEPASSATGSWQRSALRSAGVEPDVRVASPDPLIQAHFVRIGHGVAIIPALIAGQHLSGLRLLRMPGRPQRQIFTSVRRGRAHHPAVIAVRTALAEAARVAPVGTIAGEIHP